LSNSYSESGVESEEGFSDYTCRGNPVSVKVRKNMNETIIGYSLFDSFSSLIS
jgi:hypothetical protein